MTRRGGTNGHAAPEGGGGERPESVTQLRPSKATWSDVAVVHDYVTQFGGAERVALSMLRALPGAQFYTALFEPQGSFSNYAAVDVRTLRINNLAALRRHHRLAFPLLAPAFSRLRVPSDVTICSSSGWAHGVKTSGRKIVYCHSPAKWLHEPQRYFGNKNSAGRSVVATLRPVLSRWDRRAAASAHRYLANSRAIADLVRELYDVEAEVLPAPHSIDVHAPEQPMGDLEPGFFLCVSRLMPYKNVDKVVDGFRRLPGERLVVIGSGPCEVALRRSSGHNVTFAGAVDDATLRWLYRNCRAVVSASFEDFGLTPLEAAAFGRPAVVLRWGGFLDTVVEGETGLFFDAPDDAQIGSCVSRVLDMRWDAEAIAAHAARFSEARFAARLREVVLEEMRFT